MNPATVLYLPPPAIEGKTNYGDPVALIANLKKFKAHYPAMVYSEHEPYQKMLDGIAEFTLLKHDPIKVKNHPLAHQNRFSVANFCFFAGLIIANMKGYSHVIMMEADCRVGAPEWDKVMYDEHFKEEANRDLPIVMSGTVVCHNPCNLNYQAAKRWADYCATENKRKLLVPVATYGNKGAADATTPIIFTNGALSIYNMEAMNSFWDLKSSISDLSVKASPWDVEVGIQAWKQCGLSIFDRIYNMKSIYSGFGNVLTTEETRIGWLRQKKIVAAHQIKRIGGVEV